MEIAIVIYLAHLRDATTTIRVSGQSNYLVNFLKVTKISVKVFHAEETRKAQNIHEIIAFNIVIILSTCNILFFCDS